MPKCDGKQNEDRCDHIILVGISKSCKELNLFLLSLLTVNYTSDRFFLLLVSFLLIAGHASTYI